MQKKGHILFIAFSLILSGISLYGQPAENVTAADCPQEKVEVHVSQENLFSGELMWFKVYCTSPLFPKEELSTLAFVELVNSDNASVLREKILLKHGQGWGEFLILENLPTGLYYLLAYTNWMKNFGEASFFRKAVVIINPWLPFTRTQDRTDSSKLQSVAVSHATEPIIITPDRNSYSPHQQVYLKISQSNNAPVGMTNLSVSIYHKEPQMIIGNGKAHTAAAEKPAGKMTFLPDYKGIRLTGRLSDGSDKPVADARVIESVIGKGTDVRQSLTDSRGNFNFLLQPEEGEQEIVYTLPAEGLKINLEESFWNGFRNPPEIQSLFLGNKALSYLKEKFNHYQLQSRFKKQNFIRSAPEKSTGDSAVFYSRPYQLIQLKNYITLDSLREYFYELVPSVRFAQRRGELDITVRDSVTQSFYEDKPGVFVDGVLYEDYAQIARIPVKEIDHIAILPKIYYYRDFTFGGIIDIRTRKSDFNSVKPTPLMTRIIYPLGEPPEWKFYAPDYSVPGSGDRTPDFRYLLYWNPEVTSDDSGNCAVKLYTGDVTGTFVVKVMGLAADGSVLQAEKEIVVE